MDATAWGSGGGSPGRRAANGTWMLAVVIFVGTARAEDPRVTLFERYNRAATPAEVIPLVSGTLARQYASLGSQEETFRRVLKAQQLASYRSRVVEGGGATSFLVVDDAGGKQPAQAYVLEKGAAGGWTLANRLLAASIVKVLWTDAFTPAQFNQASQCAIDGREIGPRSALAVREKNRIRISLHPFLFSESDIDYWKRLSGAPAKAGTGGSHFEDAKASACVLTLELDERNAVTLFNVGEEAPPGAPTPSKVWQAPPSDIAKIEITGKRIVLDTTGRLGSETDGVRWSVTIDLPLWERGL